MYEIVQTKRKQKQFENTWEYFSEMYRWKNDPYAEDGIRYNLYYIEKVFIKERK